MLVPICINQKKSTGDFPLYEKKSQSENSVLGLFHNKPVEKQQGPWEGGGCRHAPSPGDTFPSSLQSFERGERWCFIST